MTARFNLLFAALLAAGSLSGGAVSAQDVDFGDDSGRWTRDGECDDPRFEGPGMAAATDPTGVMTDASDCRKAFTNGLVTLIAGADAPEIDEAPVTAAIDFGADTGTWINDGECDDPRFTGPGMSAAPVEADIMADASDCRALFDAGQVQMAGDMPPADDMAAGGIDFGGDTSPWINDGECDDPRFTGPGMAQGLDDSNILGDASDCRALFDAGQVQMAGADMPPADAPPADGPTPAGGVDFGADSGQWTFDGECDDPRFQGEGMADVLQDADLFADATDCRTLYDAGMISLAGAPDQSGAADPMGAVDFGADSGQWTFDGECDDPRFEGQGMADVLQDADLFADATDCRTLYDAGMITLRAQ